MPKKFYRQKHNMLDHNPNIVVSPERLPEYSYGSGSRDYTESGFPMVRKEGVGTASCVNTPTFGGSEGEGKEIDFFNLRGKLKNIIKKYKVYFNMGTEGPPKGTQIHRGPRGGHYYNSEDVSSREYHYRDTVSVDVRSDKFNAETEKQRVTELFSKLPEEHVKGIRIIYDDIDNVNEKFSAIYGGEWKDICGVYDPTEGIIYIASSVNEFGYKDFVKFYNKKFPLNPYKERHQAISLVILHELGHDIVTDNEDICTQYGSLIIPEGLVFEDKSSKGCTQYAKTNYSERFAESYLYYLQNPSHLQKKDPDMYKFMKDIVFKGKVYDEPIVKEEDSEDLPLGSYWIDNPEFITDYLEKKKSNYVEGLISKSKIYFDPDKGEKPPKGIQVMRGPKGGFYYESQAVSQEEDGYEDIEHKDKESLINEIQSLEFSLKGKVKQGHKVERLSPKDAHTLSRLWELQEGFMQELNENNLKKGSIDEDIFERRQDAILQASQFVSGIAESLEEDNFYGVSFRDSEGIHGIVTYSRYKSRIHLENLMVSPEATAKRHRRGVGTKLLFSIFQKALNNPNIKTVSVECDTDYVVDFLEKFGFEEDEEGSYGDWNPMFITREKMEKAVANAEEISKEATAISIEEAINLEDKYPLILVNKPLLNIEKSKIYFYPDRGEKPPKGVQVFRGPRGGFYYEGVLPGRKWEKGVIKNIEWERPTGDKTHGGLPLDKTWQPGTIFINRDPNGYIQATGLDRKGRAKYIKSAATVKQSVVNKFDRLKDYHKDIAKIKQVLEQNAPKHDEALVLNIQRLTSFRIGSTEETTGKVPSYGISTLLRKHITVNGDEVTLDFPGKDGIQNVATINYPLFAKRVRQVKDPNARIFNVNYKKTIKYFHDSTGLNYKSHDFRTWNATSKAIEIVKEYPVPTNAKELRKLQINVGKRVAAILGNTYTVALNHYISPEVWTPFEAKIGQEIKKSFRYFEDIEEMLETVSYEYPEKSKRNIGIIEKSKIYFKPELGEKPPKGVQVMRGKKGGYFYESGSISSENLLSYEDAFNRTKKKIDAYSKNNDEKYDISFIHEEDNIPTDASLYKGKYGKYLYNVTPRKTFLGDKADSRWKKARYYNGFDNTTPRIPLEPGKKIPQVSGSSFGQRKIYFDDNNRLFYFGDKPKGKTAYEKVKEAIPEGIKEVKKKVFAAHTIGLFSDDINEEDLTNLIDSIKRDGLISGITISTHNFSVGRKNVAESATERWDRAIKDRPKGIYSWPLTAYLSIKNDKELPHFASSFKRTVFFKLDDNLKNSSFTADFKNIPYSSGNSFNDVYSRYSEINLRKSRLPEILTTVDKIEPDKLIFGTDLLKSVGLSVKEFDSSSFSDKIRIINKCLKLLDNPELIHKEETYDWVTSFIEYNRNGIEKSKVYFKPEMGEKPPKGVQVIRGKRGGYYYEGPNKSKTSVWEDTIYRGDCAKDVNGVLELKSGIKTGINYISDKFKDAPFPFTLEDDRAKEFAIGKSRRIKGYNIPVLVVAKAKVKRRREEETAFNWEKEVQPIGHFVVEDIIRIDPTGFVPKYYVDKQMTPIEKSKVYFKPEMGEKPPKGVQVFRGKRGGYYYEGIIEQSKTIQDDKATTSSKPQETNSIERSVPQNIANSLKNLGVKFIKPKEDEDWWDSEEGDFRYDLPRGGLTYNTKTKEWAFEPRNSEEKHKLGNWPSVFLDIKDKNRSEMSAKVENTIKSDFPSLYKFSKGVVFHELNLNKGKTKEFLIILNDYASFAEGTASEFSMRRLFKLATTVFDEIEKRYYEYPEGIGEGEEKFYMLYLRNQDKPGIIIDGAFNMYHNEPDSPIFAELFSSDDDELTVHSNVAVTVLDNLFEGRERMEVFEKSKIYLSAGEQPPKGMQIQIGPHGGRFYETGLEVSPHAWHRAAERRRGDEHAKLAWNRMDNVINKLEQANLPSTPWWYKVEGDGIIAGEGEVILTVLAPHMRALGTRIRL